MSNNEEVVGIYAEDMTVAELKELCAQNNLDISGLKTKPEILKVVKKWEKKVLKETNDKLDSIKEDVKKNKNSSKSAVVEEIVEVEFHEGKKVVSKTDVTHNGREYTDIVVEGGITHRVPKIA